MAKNLFTVTKSAFGFVRAISIWSIGAYGVGRAVRGKYVYWNSHSAYICFSIGKLNYERKNRKIEFKMSKKSDRHFGSRVTPFKSAHACECEQGYEMCTHACQSYQSMGVSLHW